MVRLGIISKESGRVQLKLEDAKDLYQKKFGKAADETCNNFI